MADKKRILVIDDEPDIIRIAAFRLKKAGYDVIIAENGRTGLRLAREESPDLILLDWNIPGIHGSDLCLMFKDDRVLGIVPVIIMSAGSEVTKIDMEQMGVADIILKPYGGLDLVDMVAKLLD